jgi:hypothetical protein
MNPCPRRFRIASLLAASLTAGCAVAVDDAGDADDPDGLEEVPLSRCPGPNETDGPEAALERIQPVYASNVDDCVASSGTRVTASSKAAASAANARAAARVRR